MRNLCSALKMRPGDEIILSKLDHEANLAPWVQLADWLDITIKWWSSQNKQNPRLDAEVLRGLLSEKTRLVACTHTSNVLGTIHDIKELARTVHTIPGAMICVDGVAYAPHRQLDVRDLEVDFYAFSWYKVTIPEQLLSITTNGHGGIWPPHLHAFWSARNPRPDQKSRTLLQPLRHTGTEIRPCRFQL